MPDHFTTRLALPYPDIDDPADVPTDMQQLANRLDAVVGGVTLSGAVGDVGQPNQCRAGRQLALADFTALGLAAPRGLWNLSDLTDASGNGRALTNKGAVTFANGINGAATTAAQFTGSTAQALYIADTGAADPFRIATGSWGCWFRTAKRGVTQFLVTKYGVVNPNYAWYLAVSSTNAAVIAMSPDGTAAAQVSFAGFSDVADDRWHFAVATADGTAYRLYVDGVLEASGAVGPLTTGSAAPLNIGAAAADAATIASVPHFGRVDEAFVTADVLSDDQVRALYAARLTHTLGATPKAVSLNVRRARKGAALIPTDFVTTPLRLYNFTAGSLADQGSNAVPLINAGTAPIAVAGSDGTVGNAFSFGATATAHFAATDAGLPSALLARSYGCWFKTGLVAVNYGMLAWGTLPSNRNILFASVGSLACVSGADQITGPYVADNQWHFAVAVEDNAAADGVKRKLYLDGRLVGGSTVIGSITLAGANRFRVGADIDGTLPFTGQIDASFVTGYAMTSDEVLRLYAKGAQPLLASPKNAGDHVEGFDSGSVLFIGDTLEAQHSVDLTVS